MIVRLRALLLAITVVVPAVLAALPSGRAAAQSVAPPPADITTKMPPPAVTPLPPAPPPLEAPPSPAPAPPSEADMALKRVLRSGCQDGLGTVRAHVADPNATWAPTVTRLCNDILVERAAASPPRTVTGGNEGRGRLVLWSSLYGIWFGIATDVVLDITGPRAVIVAPLVGLGAGISISLAATRNYDLSVGEAWTIITGLDYGSFNGALWAGGLDFGDKGVVSAAVATSVAATSVGVLVAHEKSPSAGDIELVRSGLLWGTVSGFLLTVVVAPQANTHNALKAVAASMDAGFLAGVALATNVTVSRNRVLIIDAGALAGGLIGGGTAWLIAGTNNNGQGLAAAALGGVLTGITIAAFATQDLDVHDAGIAAAAPSVPAVLARDAAGRWSVGTPGPVPVLDGTGTRLLGATFNAVGGQF
jgi:hypothetical protein